MYNSFNAASSFIGQIRDQFIQLCTNHELLYNLLFSFNIITFGMLIDLRRFNCEQESLLHLLNVLMSSPHFKINRFSKCLRLSGNKNLYNLLKAGQINRHYPCCGDFSNEIPMPLNMQDIEDDLSISMTDYDESLYSAIQRVYAQLLHATNRNRLNEILLNFDQSAIDQSVNNDVKLNPYADKKLQALLDALLYSESRRIDSICLQERQIEMSACAAPDTSTQHSYIDNQPSSSPICSCVQINENECLQSTRNGESFYESRHFIPNGSQLTNCSQMPIFGEQIRRQIANTFFNGNNSVTDLSVETLIAYLQNCTNIHTPDDNMFLEEPNRNFTVIYLTAQAVQKYPYLDPHSKVPRQKYEMVHFPRGHCLILNYMHFTDHETRRGTDLDALKLQRLFEQLGFIVILRSDLYYLATINEISEFISIVRSSQPSPDAAVLIILSHGELDVIFTSDSKRITLRTQVFDKFEGLIPNKPKLFIIQACRGALKNLICGHAEQSAVNRSRTSFKSQRNERIFTLIGRNIGRNFFKHSSKSKHGSKFLQETDHIAGSQFRKPNIEYDSKKYTPKPMRSDMFIWYSTIADYVSIRCASSGTVFINTLVSVLSKAGWCYELSQLSECVNRVINNKIESMLNYEESCYSLRNVDFHRVEMPASQHPNNDDDHPAQTPCSENYLMKALYFNPGFFI